MVDFQILDADTTHLTSCNSEVLSSFRENHVAWCDGCSDLRELKRSAAMKDERSVLLVRLWGRTADGKSVCVVVCDACVTMYRKLACTPSRAQRVKDDLQGLLRTNLSPERASVSIVWRHTTNGWVPDPRDCTKPLKLPWLKVCVASQALVPIVTSNINRLWRQYGDDSITKTTAQTAVTPHAAVLLDAGLEPSGWVRVPEASLCRSSPRVGVDACFQVKTLELKPSGGSAAVAPLRVASFDIECFSASGAFPDANLPEDPIITIGIYTKTLFAADPRTDAVALCLGEADEPPESDADRHRVVACQDERSLLVAFCRELRASDADVLVGYNIAQFDWRYLWSRARLLHLEAELSALSRVRYLSCPVAETKISSASMGDNTLSFPRLPGRINLDLWFHLKRADPPDLPNLKLNTVAKHYLKDSKHDLPAKVMFRKFAEGGAAGRGEVASYCVQDCRLVLQILEKLETIPGILEMSKVTRTTPEDINFRGQQIRVYSQFVKEAQAQEYLVEDSQGDGDDGYKGATVVEPISGFYSSPVVTLDFASLYPSIMRTFNLSPDTFLGPECANLFVEEAPVPNTTDRFVPSSVRCGILPKILETLLIERKRVRKGMATATGLEYTLLNSKQLALKVSANSVYGACGASRGLISCVKVASATTGAGRHIIDHTKETIEASVEGCRVIYGDTDSCFVLLPERYASATPHELFRVGEELAGAVTKELQDRWKGSHVVLEMEKFLCPLVLYCKKRYIGISVDDPEKTGKVLAKGVEVVRRDALPVTRRTMEAVISKLLHERDAAGCIALVQAAVQWILRLRGGDDLTEIVQSKNLAASYQNPDGMAHVRVVDLVRRRSPGSETRVGGRVEYLVVASETARVVDKAEDIECVREHRLPPDWLHYVEAIEKPLMRLLDVPLQTLDPQGLGELRLFFGGAKVKAKALLKQYGMSRNGVDWFAGLPTKDGGTQLKLFFDSASLGDVVLPIAPRPVPPKAGGTQLKLSFDSAKQVQGVKEVNDVKDDTRASSTSISTSLGANDMSTSTHSAPLPLVKPGPTASSTASSKASSKASCKASAKKRARSDEGVQADLRSFFE